MFPTDMQRVKEFLVTRCGLPGFVLWAVLAIIWWLAQDMIGGTITEWIKGFFTDPDPATTTIINLAVQWGPILFLGGLAFLIIWLAYKFGIGGLGGTTAWAERKRLEIYVIANVSCGKSAHQMPIDKAPALDRLRLLKDEISDGNLKADYDGDEPNIWATVTLPDFEAYLNKFSHKKFALVAQKWRKTNSQGRAAGVTTR